MKTILFDEKEIIPVTEIQRIDCESSGFYVRVHMYLKDNRNVRTVYTEDIETSPSVVNNIIENLNNAIIDDECVSIILDGKTMRCIYRSDLKAKAKHIF